MIIYTITPIIIMIIIIVITITIIFITRMNATLLLKLLYRTLLKVEYGVKKTTYNSDQHVAQL